MIALADVSRIARERLPSSGNFHHIHVGYVESMPPMMGVLVKPKIGALKDTEVRAIAKQRWLLGSCLSARVNLINLNEFIVRLPEITTNE